MSEQSPLRRHSRLDWQTLEDASPLLVMIGLALAFAWGIRGGTGFSYGLGILGAILGMWGVYLAVQATEDGRELRRSVERMRALDELRLLRQVKIPVARLSFAREQTVQGGETKFLLSREDRLSYAKLLGDALEGDSGRELYICDLLWQNLDFLPAIADHQGWKPTDPLHPDQLDYGPLVSAAFEEVQSMLLDARRRLDAAGRRQIPLIEDQP